MLSSRDYNLITEWIQSGISKEQILKGIRNTFNNKDIKSIRSLHDCIEFIDLPKKSIENTEQKPDKAGSETSSYLVGILHNFNRLITDSPNENIKAYFLNIYDKLKKLINSENEEVFSNINSLEEEFFQNYTEHMDNNDKNIFEKEINIFLNSGNDYINEKSKNKALNNFTKNFIIDNYLGFNPFEL